MKYNAFFDLALKRAGSILGRRQRLLLLLSKLGLRLKDVQWNQAQQVGVKEKVYALARMLKAYVHGRYTDIPWRSLLLLTAAIIYFVNPLDLIPDFIVGLGFTDDFGVLLMVYHTLHHELEKFLTWEKSQAIEL